MHHAMYCFIERFFQNRTMILESQGWRYDSKNGYEGYFLPVTETCANQKSPETVTWNGKLENNELRITRVFFTLV